MNDYTEFIFVLVKINIIIIGIWCADIKDVLQQYWLNLQKLRWKMVTCANLANGSEFLSLGAHNEKPCPRKFS